MKLIAHRGASAYAPENTMAAFELALRMGAQEVEFDVHPTQDGRLAVLHDADLKRVARSPRKVKDLTLRELKSFDVGSWFKSAFSGERVPALEEVLDLLRGKALAHVEVKDGGVPGLVERLVQTLLDREALEWSFVSSFDHALLKSLRRTEPRLRLGVLAPAFAGSNALRVASELKAVSLDVGRRGVTPRLVEAAHERGLQVLAYTVNEASQAQRLERMGLDGVFSDHPDLLSASAALGGTK